MGFIVSQAFEAGPLSARGRGRSPAIIARPSNSSAHLLSSGHHDAAGHRGRRWRGGFFAAITCAEAAPGDGVTLLEKAPHFLSKVRISGGGRCNVTHACFDPRELAARYPRGGRALIGPFHRFQPQDTMDWFEARG